MASIDEAYLDMTGTGRLHGPAMKAADLLHQTMKRETRLNCSIGIAAARVVAKVASDQAKPNGVLQVLPGLEASFLAPLAVRRLPGVGKVTEEHCASTACAPSAIWPRLPKPRWVLGSAMVLRR